MIDRYSCEVIKKIWSDKNKFKIWLDIELLSMKAHCKLGLIPIEDYELVKSKAKFSVKRIQEIEEQTKHDVIAFTRCISESLGEEKKWVHYGLTSSDVVDTATSYMIKESNEEIQLKILELLEVLKEKARLYKRLLTIGRTHGMHAEITSFGVKYALWYEMLSRHYKRFLDARVVIEVGLISGAVGNYANVDPFIQEYVCGKMDLDSVKISTQILSRDRHAQYLTTIAVLGACLENIATEMRHLQRTEVNEVEEFFSSNQKGSSAMPHKKNPISFENICGLSRVLRGYAITSLENIALWHERDITHSSAERIIIPDAISVIYYMLNRLTNTLNNLKVNENKISTNIDLTNGLIFSQKVLLKLIDKNKWTREKAYDTVQPIAMESYTKKVSFRKLLEDSDIGLDKKDLDICFDKDSFLENIDYIYERLGL